MEQDIRSHIDGDLETVKFAHRREKYYDNLEKILALGHPTMDYLHHWGAFAGTLTMNRYLTLYELYKSVMGIQGHIGEVGAYKGGATLFFGKLVQMFEHESLTMVHAWDHFQGTDASTDSPLQVAGGNLSSEETLRELIRLQHLENTVKIHNMNAITEFTAFFDKYPHLMFKLIFMDSGTYEVTRASVSALWPRLSVGGIMIFDQLNNEVAPGETRAVRELLPNAKIETIPGSWMPGSWIRKV